MAQFPLKNWLKNLPDTFIVIAVLPWLLIFGLIIYLVYRFIWKRVRSPRLKADTLD